MYLTVRLTLVVCLFVCYSEHPVMSDIAEILLSIAYHTIREEAVTLYNE